MRFLYLLLLPTFVWGATPADISSARQSIERLISPFALGKTKTLSAAGIKNFEVEDCDKRNINWRELLTFQSSLTLIFSFNDHCDIEGTVSPMLIRPFPANLKVRDLMDFNQVETMNKITSTLESRPIMNLEMRDGKLKSKRGSVHFEVDYSVRINPLRKDDPIEENLGGELRIKEIYGQKVSIKEKIMIK